MKYLSQLLIHDKSPQPFLEKHFSRLPFSLPGGAADFLEYLNWKIVEKVIQSKKSSVRIVKDGKMTKDSLEHDFALAKSYYDQGNSIWIKNAEKADEALNNMAKDFSASFHTDVDVQLYCTPNGHNAFGWHYDVEEVFILQVKGSKEYTIRQNTIHSNPLVKSIPKDLGYDKETSDLAMKITLEPGDWLYIPSGWWHVAQTRSESMHISIGLMPSSAMDIVNFMQAHMNQLQLWRRRMPIHKEFESLEAEIDFYQEAMGKLGEDITRQLSSREFIRQFLDYKKMPT